MPDHDPTKVAELDEIGEQRWSFSLRYILPEHPADNRDWFSAITITDESVHNSEEAYRNGVNDEVFGSAWVKKNEILFLMKATGRYSSAFEAVTTRVDFAEEGMATFIIHGKEEGEVATIKVRRTDEGASVAVDGDITGPPQELEADGFTKPTPVVDGAELSTFGAGGAWVIDVSDDNVAIQGSCEGM